ncbi:MAG: GNAT family N-acetyltransferase [Bacteroidetes bacterium]|jgi:hypothetical protein|nr:GNAT family N-acetyltransferase [Bacteroidota bacterium]
MKFEILNADASHEAFAEEICQQYAESARDRGTGIAQRQPAYIRTKIQNGNAIIALQDGQVAGFCYIEVWSHERYVANSGLIVFPQYRQHGLARQIKAKAFELSRTKYPHAKLFGITTSMAVMRINSDLGYRPVTFSELTQDDAFWAGCKSCPNYDILERNQRRMCLCTAMLAPSQEEADAMAYDLSNLIVNQR